MKEKRLTTGLFADLIKNSRSVRDPFAARILDDVFFGGQFDTAAAWDDYRVVRWRGGGYSPGQITAVVSRRPTHDSRPPSLSSSSSSPTR